MSKNASLDSSTDSDASQRNTALANRKQTLKKPQRVVEYFKNKTIELKRSSLFNDSAYATQLSNISTATTTTTTATKPSHSKTIQPKNFHYYIGIGMQTNKENKHKRTDITQEQPTQHQRVTDESVDLLDMNTHQLANYIDRLRMNFRNTHLPQCQQGYQSNQRLLHHQLQSQQKVQPSQQFQPQRPYSQQQLNLNYEYQLQSSLHNPSHLQPGTKSHKKIEDDEFIKFTESIEILDDQNQSNSTAVLSCTSEPFELQEEHQQIDESIRRYNLIRRDASTRLDMR